MGSEMCIRDRVTVDTSSQKVRDTFAEAAQARQAELELKLRESGCRHIVLGTDSDWIDQIVRSLVINKKLDTLGRGPTNHLGVRK